MIGRDDLRAALGAGIMSEAQAASLSVLADSRRGARANLNVGDEPFELFKGFNEIFIVVGLLVLTFGWSGVATLIFGGEIVDVKQYGVLYGASGAAVLWLLSEYFVRRRRMIAPSIALSVLFAFNATFLFSVIFAQPFMIVRQDMNSLQLPFGLATFSLFLYWLRFRVPFAMAMIAVGLFIVAIMIAASSSGSPQNPSELFLLSAGGPFAWFTLVLGLIVFAVAMVFDMSDPHRVTRRSANGFWLHVVAAPALVNTIALTLLDRDAHWALFGIMMIFALIAIIIDRRSFLIAAIGYILALTATVFEGDGTVFTVLAFGVILLLLGAFWERIRTRLLKLLPGFVPLHRLPPSNL